MAWIESHIDLGEHPKLQELCFALNLKKHEVIGHLHLLWHFTMKYAWRDGDLRRFSARVICQAVGWERDHDTFIRSLQETGWLDKDSLVVHDWLHYAGKLVKDRLYNESRRNTSFNDVNDRKTSATLPNPTLPNLTEPKTKTKDSLNASRFTKPQVPEIQAYALEIGFTSLNPQRFFDYYESNGWRVGRNPMKDWKAAVRQWRTREENNGNGKRNDGFATTTFGKYPD